MLGSSSEGNGGRNQQQNRGHRTALGEEFRNSERRGYDVSNLATAKHTGVPYTIYLSPDWNGTTLMNTSVLRRYLWIAITGLVVTTIVANLRIPIFSGWEIPLERSAITSSQLYGAKAATLAILGAMALLSGLVFSSPNGPARINFFTGITTVAATLAAGWFWLLGETDGNPVPFLIALIPAIVWMAGFIAVMELVGIAERIDRRNIKELGTSRLDLRFMLATFGFFAVSAGVIYMMIWLPPRLF